MNEDMYLNQHLKGPKMNAVVNGGHNFISVLSIWPCKLRTHNMEPSPGHIFCVFLVSVASPKFVHMSIRIIS